MIAFSECSDLKMVLNVGHNDKAVTDFSAVCIKHDCFDCSSVFVCYLLDTFMPTKTVKHKTMHSMSSFVTLFLYFVFTEVLSLLFLFSQVHK